MNAWRTGRGQAAIPTSAPLFLLLLCNIAEVRKLPITASYRPFELQRRYPLGFQYEMVAEFVYNGWERGLGGLITWTASQSWLGSPSHNRVGMEWNKPWSIWYLVFGKSRATWDYSQLEPYSDPSVLESLTMTRGDKEGLDKGSQVPKV